MLNVHEHSLRGERTDDYPQIQLNFTNRKLIDNYRLLASLKAKLYNT